jgi:hypothetical protein
VVKEGWSLDLHGDGVFGFGKMEWDWDGKLHELSKHGYWKLGRS